jgi:cytochrome c-type biogenesis protein CcmH
MIPSAARIFLLLLLCLAAGRAMAVLPDEILEDPALEARARALSAEVRCLVCQNESIDSSHAELARELRLLIRERLVAGDDEDEIKAFLVSRYGEFVLLKPPFEAATALLWIGPFALLLIGLAVILLYFRRQSQTYSHQGPGVLSPDETARLSRLLEPAGDAPADEGQKGSPQ